MKKAYLLGILVCLSGLLSAQNIMFVNYEKFASYDKVKHYCVNRPSTDLLYEQHKQLMLFQLESFIFRYEFFEGKLYRITMTKEFNDEKLARETEKSILYYFNVIGAQAVERVSLGNTRRHVYLRDGRVMELFITYHHEKAITFELSSKYVGRTPTYDLDRYTDLVTGPLMSSKDR